MPLIRQLSTSVINKIAAGEVIERPASVVKELLENSLDAGATRIDITVEQGGIELIRIVDNGCGIAPEQLPLAVAAHATSKLQSADDLFQVKTLGFRGEALASIAEISHFTLRSRETGSEAGAELVVNGGEHSPVVPVGSPPGTTIEVRQLFFNTPVRRKFMRSVSTELSHITEALTRCALAYPHVHFTLTHGTKQNYDLPPTNNLSERVGAFFGEELARDLIWVESRDNDIWLRGYVAKPNQNRANNRLQYLFLNGRAIRDRSLQHALSEAYRGVMMVGRYPIAFLQLDMPPELVDVNVHPTKLEVRFQDSGRLYSQLLGTIRAKFLTSDLSAKLSPASSKVSVETTTSVPSNAPAATQTELLPWERDNAREERRLPVHDDLSIRPVIGTQQELAHDVAGAHDPATAERLRSDLVHWARGELQAQQRQLDQQAVALRPTTTTPLPADESEDAAPQYGHAPLPEYTFQRPQPTIPPAPYPGPSRGVAPSVAEPAVPERTTSNSAIQIHNKYLVAETDDGLVVIDQHALHERIIYEQIREKVLAGAVESQQLLVPEPVDLSANEATAILQHQAILSQIGVSLEPFGGGTVLVTSYPAMLANFRPAEVLREIVAQITIEGKTPERRDLLDELLHMISCKAAIKAGDRLTPAEVEALVAQRDLFQDSHHCPHGRPTALVLTRDDLDKQFKRT